MGTGDARVTPLPGPEEIAEDYGIIDVDDVRDGTPSPGGTGSGPGAPRSPAPGPQPEDPDEPPAHARRDWRRGPQKRSRNYKPPRVTAGVRADIDAKIRFALQVPGAIWQARDPLCGGTFVQQIPDVAEAFTDIVVESADLVAFFTGPGGHFMRFLKIGAAVMPVVEVVAAHHVYHSVELAEDGTGQDGTGMGTPGQQARYAA